MAITYSISPNPHWVLIDNFDRLPVGAAIYTFSSLNPSVFKPAYEDAGGTIPFGQPIVGFGNGTMPPIFWSFNDAVPDDLYYIQVWDKVRIPGGDAVMLWDFNGIPAMSGGGGGSVITTNLDLENLIINGEFYRNAGNQAGPSIPTQITLAPSNNSGIAGIANAVSDGPPAPDIIFAKSDTSAIDSLSFINFPQGDNTFSPNPTPQQYVNYTTAVAGSETYKYVQFPIVKGLQNINNVNVSFQMWNRVNGGDTNISIFLRQFFGNGPGATADILTPMGLLNLIAGVWTKTQLNAFLVPGINPGMTIGPCGNDILFLQIRFPLSALVNLDFILPALYPGDTNSTIDFHTLDAVDSIVNSPRTGDVRITLNSFSPYGWVPMNDGSIGSATSGATTRANIDTFPLFDLIWNAVPDADAPVSGGRGASSIADFSANKNLTLTKQAGRVIAGISASHLLGTIGGSDTHINTIGEMAAHTHPGSVGGQSAVSGSADGCIQGAAASSFGQTLHIASQGGGAAWDIRQTTIYNNIFIKL